MNKRNLAVTAGASYIVIFFAAIFANFFMLEKLMADPLGSVTHNSVMIRWGIMAFIITVVFDVVVAWALNELYKDHSFTGLSTLFRMMHAAVMAVGVFALTLVFQLGTEKDILYQLDIFNNIWLIGLFFFGIHLILLGLIAPIPRWICIFLMLAGSMYMLDTTLHFVMPNYEDHADLLLAMVALPSVIGEMSLAIYLLAFGYKINDREHQ